MSRKVDAGNFGKPHAAILAAEMNGVAGVFDCSSIRGCTSPQHA